MLSRLEGLLEIVSPKMADGRHLGKVEKSPYLRNGLTDRHEIWHDDSSFGLRYTPTVKISTF